MDIWPYLLVHCLFLFSFKCKVISNTWDSLFQVTFPNVLKFVRNTLLHNLYLIIFSAFGNVAKPSLLCSLKCYTVPYVVTWKLIQRAPEEIPLHTVRVLPDIFSFFFQVRISVENYVWKSLSFYRLPWVWYAVVECNICQQHNSLFLAFGFTQHIEAG